MSFLLPFVLMPIQTEERSSFLFLENPFNTDGSGHVTKLHIFGTHVTHSSCQFAIRLFLMLTVLLYNHKVLTYVEYRAVSGVFQNIDPPPPSPPSECALPMALPLHRRRREGGVYTLAGR